MSDEQNKKKAAKDEAMAKALDAKDAINDVKPSSTDDSASGIEEVVDSKGLGRVNMGNFGPCLLYTSPSPRDSKTSRMPSSA